MKHVLTALSILAVLTSVALASETTTNPKLMPLDQVRPGMKGHGISVFQGSNPERFEVEVIDVLRNFRPKQEIFLIKTKHPRLEVAKVVAGMSGSPIYINGKMIGAYAYGWTFGADGRLVSVRTGVTRLGIGHVGML